MRKRAVLACLVGPGSQDPIVEPFVVCSLVVGSHVEPAQISKLGDAHKVYGRRLRGDVKCGDPRALC
jgi:hypothetical protein